MPEHAEASAAMSKPELCRILSAGQPAAPTTLGHQDRDHHILSIGLAQNIAQVTERLISATMFDESRNAQPLIGLLELPRDRRCGPAHSLFQFQRLARLQVHADFVPGPMDRPAAFEPATIERIL